MKKTLPLRLTYKELDIVFYILNNRPLAMEQDITVSLDGQTYQLYKNMGKWEAKDKSLTNKSLLDAIGDSIGLRYRI